MPVSDPENKGYASELIARLQPRTVLDVGPGVGTYGQMVRDLLSVDRLEAVEIWAPYVETYKLSEIYDRIAICDVRFWQDFDFDLVILGDVLEHLAVDDAVEIWNRVSLQARGALISIPIVHYEQGKMEGNPYEAHLTPNWTTSAVRDRFAGITEFREFSITGLFYADFRQQSQKTTNEIERKGVTTTWLAKDLPLVSCILPTYGRPPGHQHLVEEAIESFLRQDYPNKELIVLNDCPGQELVCDAPGVQVFNVAPRFATLGEKRNAGVRLSIGEFIAVWDDDDIILPWRLSHSVDRIGSNDYYCAQFSWYQETVYLSTDVHVLTGGPHSLYRRDAFDVVGGYPADSYQDDVLLADRFRQRGNSGSGALPSVQDAVRSDVYYIYRRGVSPSHITGRNEDGTYVEIGTRATQTGRYVLRPHWRTDYEGLIRSIWEGPPKGDPDRADPNKSPDILLDLSQFLTVTASPQSQLAIDEHSAAVLPEWHSPDANTGQTKSVTNLPAVHQKAQWPLVSCCLPTYNRVPDHAHLVEEAIESFLRQDYPNKELILLNDTPGQELVCDAPGVMVVNVAERYPTLGEKRNALVQLAKGELLAVWDDDDISLPWRLSQSVEKMGNLEYYCDHLAWYQESQWFSTDVHVLTGGPHAIYRRDAFDEVGGYPPINYGIDLALQKLIRDRGKSGTGELPHARTAERREIHYIYRRGVSPVHITGHYKDGMYVEIGHRPVVKGRFELRPHWRMDYEALAKSVWEGPPDSGPSDARPGRGPDLPVTTHEFVSVLNTTVSPLGTINQSRAAARTHDGERPQVLVSRETELKDEDLPLVSCILPTYGRPPSHLHLVEEAVESFLRQDYPNKELVLLNDCPDQYLVCDAPGVRVFNHPQRFATLGEKRTAGISLALGEYIAPWDDDDISLPWRLSHSMLHMGDTEYFNSGLSWYMDRQFIYPDVKEIAGGSLSTFKRSAFIEVGGYPPTSFGEDTDLEKSFAKHGKSVGSRHKAASADRSEIYYIYRWGVSSNHLSGRNDHGAYEDIGRKPVTSGSFEIVPHWRMDYVAACHSFTARCSNDAKQKSPQ
ncbi:MAG: glycosyltransferase, partial [Thermomicrobiales bacterium]